jgi:pyruvate/2-oxoglutarate dehydrogenase complex dihydrolipoamide acyltransferase (E2) component
LTESDGIAITGVRRIIADRMSESLRVAAQLSYHATICATSMVAAREAWKQQGLRVGFEDIVLRALADATIAYPALNGMVKNDRIHRIATVDACVAIDLPGGLVAPAIWDIGGLTVPEISEARRAVVERARSGKLTVREMTGGSITLSNLGGTRVEHFTPILNGGQIAILGIGRITPRPWIDGEGQVSIQPVMGLSLTVDHRIVDGAESGAFLSYLGDVLEAQAATAAPRADLATRPSPGPNFSNK